MRVRGGLPMRLMQPPQKAFSARGGCNMVQRIQALQWENTSWAEARVGKEESEREKETKRSNELGWFLHSSTLGFPACSTSAGWSPARHPRSAMPSPCSIVKERQRRKDGRRRTAATAAAVMLVSRLPLCYAAPCCSGLCTQEDGLLVGSTGAWLPEANGKGSGESVSQRGRSVAVTLVLLHLSLSLSLSRFFAARRQPCALLHTLHLHAACRPPLPPPPRETWSLSLEKRRCCTATGSRRPSTSFSASPTGRKADGCVSRAEGDAAEGCAVACGR